MRFSTLALAISFCSSCFCLLACEADEEPTSAVGGAGGTPEDELGAGGTGPTFVDCDGNESADGMIASTRISRDARWSGVVHVTGDVAVDAGATLTIEPGAHIVVSPDRQIVIGPNNSVATLDAAGTEAAPIRFCGKEASKGYWKNLSVGTQVTSDSVLSHAVIADGGANDAALVLRTGIGLQNVEVRHGATDGVWAADFVRDSASLSVHEHDGAAAVLLTPDAVTRFPLGGTIEGNEEQLVRLRFGPITEDVTVPALAVPYLQEKSVESRNGAHVTFEAGVDYRFAADTYLQIGWNNADGELTIAGTESAPVRFSGASGEPGFWGGLLVGKKVRSSSSISYLELQHAGGQDLYALQLDSAVKLVSVTLSDNDWGAYISANGLVEGSSGLSVTSSTGVPVSVEPDALPSLPRDGSFEGNGEDVIEVKGGYYHGTDVIPYLGVPYLFAGNVSTQADSHFELEPGNTVIMASDTYLQLGTNNAVCTFALAGTSAAPIVFRGSSPTAGFWGGVEVGSKATSTVGFANVEIHHAGGPSVKAALALRRATLVKRTKLVDCAGYGILKLASDSSDYEATNTFTRVASGSVSNF